MVPVVLLSVGVNLSRWFELELQEYEVTQPVRSDANATTSADDEYDDYDAYNDNNTEKVVVIGIAGTWLRYNQVKLFSLDNTA